MLDFLAYSGSQPSKASLFKTWLQMKTSGSLRSTVYKSRFLASLLGNHTEVELKAKARAFQSEIIPGKLSEKALRCLNEFKSEGAEIVIATASLDLWLAEWAEKKSLNLISTKSAFEDGRFKGISGMNCKSEEKLRRIRKLYDFSNYEEVHAFGDSPADIPMLKAATHAYYRKFD